VDAMLVVALFVVSSVVRRNVGRWRLRMLLCWWEKKTARRSTGIGSHNGHEATKDAIHEYRLNAENYVQVVQHLGTR
jgi:hypothetical protein